MPLTPADVHNVVFKKPPIGKRGYDEDEVDAFLDVVEAELARLIEENNDLRSSGSRTERPESAPMTVAAPPPPPAQTSAQVREDDSIRASRMLALATETAERHVNEAKAQADQMVGSAKSSSDRMMSEARAKSEQMVGEAKNRADAMLGDARTRADTMEREARAKATALAQDAERKHVEAMGSLVDVSVKVDELRTFEREYRTRLRSYLESHLRDLDSRGSAEPASANRQAQHVGA
jgi:DivIVA domain-containing protein